MVGRCYEQRAYVARPDHFTASSKVCIVAGKQETDYIAHYCSFITNEFTVIHPGLVPRIRVADFCLLQLSKPTELTKQT